MKLAECLLQSTSIYSQSRFHNTEKLPKELSDAYEKRTWRNRCNTDKDGHIFIPPMAFANSLKEAAKFLDISIPGKGKQKFTKHFEAGVMVRDPLVLSIKADDVAGEWVYVPSDGRRGGTTRVLKCFPRIDFWKGKVEYYIYDDIITKDIFEQVIRASGNFIGIGRFRPRNYGY